MEKPLESCLRMGIVHFMAFPGLAGGDGPWEETARHIALDPFFHAIEITHVADPGVRGRLRSLLRLANLSVGFGVQPVILSQGLDLNSRVEEERARAVRALQGYLDEAVSMGAESFTVLSGKDPGAADRPRAVASLVRSLKDLCAYSAQRGGPKIVAEVFDREVDKRCLLGPAPLAGEVAQAVTADHENFGVLVDLGHLPLLGESPKEAIEPVRKHLAAAHVGNAVVEAGLPGYGDQHPIFGTPGGANGVAEVVEFLRALADIGFFGGPSRPMVSFEIKPMPGQDPLVMIANAKRVLNTAWALA